MLIGYTYKRGLLKWIFLFAFMSAIVWSAAPSVSDDFTDRRMTAGAKIFRALLAADLEIEQKIDTNGSLNLYLIYVEHTENAERVEKILKNRDDPRVRRLDIQIRILSFSEYVNRESGKTAGIFLTENLSKEALDNIIDFTRKNHILVFSPLEGDVERGVQCGIAIEARVRPYLNARALQDADIRLKSFIRRVAKLYEN